MEKTLNEIVDVERVNKHTANFKKDLSSLDYDKYDAYMEKVDNEPINYTECLTFREFAKKYNDLYTAFMKDYNALPEKMNIGREIDVLDYYEDKNIYPNYRRVRLFIYKNNQVKGNNDSAYFDIFEKNGDITNCIHNDYNKPSYDKNFFRKSLDIKSEILKSYLDLFEKHQEFIKIFNNAHRIALSDQSWVMVSFFGDNYLNITDGISQFNIHGYLCDSNNFIFDLHFKLGEDFGIDYDKTKFYIFDTETKFPKEEIESFADSMYVNKYYLIVEANKNILNQKHDIIDENIIYRIYSLRNKICKLYNKNYSVDTVIYILQSLCNWPVREKFQTIDNDNDDDVYFRDILEGYFALFRDEDILIQYEVMMNDYGQVFNDTKEKEIVNRLKYRMPK